jgi:hypothetical protein
VYVNIDKKSKIDLQGYLILAGPGNPTWGWIYQGIYNLYKIYSSTEIPLPPLLNDR